MNAKISEGRLAKFAKSSQCLLMDGSFCSELQHLDYEPHDQQFWTASANISDIQKVKEVYQRFADAGCDVISTNTYHGSLKAMEPVLGLEISRQSLKNAVEAAISVRDSQYNELIVLGAIGPYGVTLRDASEYTGSYVDDPEKLPEMQSYYDEQAHFLLECGPLDGLLFETIPSLADAQYVARVVNELGSPAVVSFSCKDGEHVRHGEPLAEAVEALLGCPTVFGVGINCTSPRDVTSLLRSIQHLGLKERGFAVFVYPNSGEEYIDGGWRGTPLDLVDLVDEWHSLGARCVGGCCRVSIDQLKLMRPRISAINAFNGT